MSDVCDTIADLKHPWSIASISHNLTKLLWPAGPAIIVSELYVTPTALLKTYQYEVVIAQELKQPVVNLGWDLQVM